MSTLSYLIDEEPLIMGDSRGILFLRGVSWMRIRRGSVEGKFHRTERSFVDIFKYYWTNSRNELLCCYALAWKEEILTNNI